MKKRDLYNMAEFNDYSDNEQNDPDYIEEDENELGPDFYDYSRAAYPEYPEENEEDYIPVQRRQTRGGGGYFEPEYYLSDPDFQKYLLKNGLISYDDDSDTLSSDTSDSDSEQNVKRRKNKTKQNKTKQTKKKTTTKKKKK